MMLDTLSSLNTCFFGRIFSSFAATTTTPVPLPAQCSSYTVYADSTRLTTYTSSSVCDSGVFGTSGVWVRFQSPGGTLIPSSAPSTSTCGTDAPGWYNGPYPSSLGSTTLGTVCYNWSGATCNWSNQISITHCGSYFVFLLVDPPVCNLRYCNVWCCTTEEIIRDIVCSWKLIIRTTDLINLTIQFLVKLYSLKSSLDEHILLFSEWEKSP